MIIIKDIHSKTDKKIKLNKYQQETISLHIQRLIRSGGFDAKIEVKED